jgi:tetratricopeptide (TPR) repeat protein
MRATLMYVAAAAVICGLLPSRVGGTQAVTYRQVVDRYRTDPDDGVERMLALSEAERKAGLDQALSASGAAAWTWEEIAAAAMMHTDAGFYFLSRKEPGIPHLADAERLLAWALLTLPGHGPFVRRWYTIVQSVVADFGDGANARWFSDKYLERVQRTPQRAKALEAYHRGVLAEFDGCQKGEFLTITGLTESGSNLVQRYFVPAAHHLSTALALEPELLDAALHLGRIRMLEGRDADAVPLFERAAAAKTRSVSYLAKLFLGAFAERTARWNDAEALYGEALRISPTGQSAALALAQLLDRRGRATDGARVLAQLLALPEPRRLEPWSVYFDEARRDNAMLIRHLRSEVMR